MEKVFTPSLLWNYLRAYLRYEPFHCKVEGVFRGLNHEREYGGKFYGTLLDGGDGRTTITLRIPRLLISEFVGREGATFVVEGVPFWDVRPEFGRAEVVLDVKSIEGVDTESLRMSEKALLLEEKLSKGWRDLEGILSGILMEGRKPKVCLLVGETAIVDRDVLKALGEERERYEIRVERVSFLDVEALVRKVSSLDGECDLLAVVRGGGSGLEVFDDERLARTCLSLETPFVTALGHAKDFHLLDRLSDRYFITPTELGKFLSEVARRVVEREVWEREKTELLRKLARSEESSGELLRRLERTEKERNVLLVLLFLLLLLVSALLFL